MSGFNYKTLALRRLMSHLLWLLLFYFCFRIAFIAFNANFFPSLTFGQIVPLLFKGLRFDISIILLLNLPFILMMLLPFRVLRFRWYNGVMKIIFLIINSIAILFEISDWAYFPFNHKRSTSEVLDIVGTKGDFFNLLPGFLKNYWYLFLIAIGIIILLNYTYNLTARKFKRKETLARVMKPGEEKQNWSGTLVKVVILLVSGGLIVIGIRGGLQLKPLTIGTAVLMTRSEYTPIILNTPYSISRSVNDYYLQPKHYMPEQEAVNIVHPIKNYDTGHQKFKPDNVVVIILESFSKEFTGLTDNTRSYTPFLDSLMGKSMTFTNAYANGLHSAEGIPAIIGGIPSLINGYYTLSQYVNNKIETLPSLLKKMGYHTAFYHGASNGSMGFNVFASAAGYDHYYGRREYDNDKDYDGHWGIFDEPFLQYFAHGLDTLKEPFMASIFTVTSHPPYPLPDKYKGTFPTGKLAIYPCVGYTDMALRKFFEAVKNQPWFQNTLFVISPDHCSPMASNQYYATGTGRYQIPILFYAPGDSVLVGYKSTLMQQIDILPSVMDYLNYPDSFFCFGHSIFQKDTNRFVISRLGNVYDWIYGGYQSLISQDKLLESYAFPEDSHRRYNLVVENKNYHLSPQSKKTFNAYIQIYNQVMVDNKMTVTKFNNFLSKKEQRHEEAN